MSHLNSKICLSVKGSVYLSLYSGSHRKWSTVLTPSDFCFTLKPSLNPRQQEQKERFSELADLVAAVPSALSLVSAFCSQLAALLHFAHSLLCKSPIWAIRTAIYTGFLLLRAQQAARSFHRTHSCGFLSGGGNPPPKVAACEGCQREHQGWHLVARSVHGVWIREENTKGKSTSFDSLRVEKWPKLLGPNTRVKTGPRDQTLLGRRQSSTPTPKMEIQGPLSVPFSSSDDGVVLFLALPVTEMRVGFWNYGF